MWRKKLTSSGGLNDGAMCPTADGNVRCECDSTRPGMTLAPVQSTTWSFGSMRVPPPAWTLSIRSPRTTTSAGAAGAPVPSKTCPLTNTMRFTPKVNLPAGRAATSFPSNGIRRDRRHPAGKTGPVNVDVLVIGCGPAGASAAIAPHDAGASVLVREERGHAGGNALVAGGFLWDARGPEAVRHVETLFFGKTGRSVAQAYVAGLNDLRAWISELGGSPVVVDPPPGSFPAVIPSWPPVPGSDGVRYWVVGGHPDLRRGEALWRAP